jgi:preprotein translocase subunit SecD
VILFWFGTSLVKGFALVFGIGVIVSMLTAITVTRLFLLAIGDYENKGWVKKLFSNGLKN